MFKDKQRFKNITHNERRMQFLVGRLMIYHFLGRRFKVEKSGKLTHKNCYLSLTHSSHVVVLALSSIPVGIDTENILKKRNFKNICQFLNLGRCSDLKGFYKLFTQYEADYKLGNQYPKKHHTFLLWQNFIICIASLSKEPIEVFEHIPC